MSIWLAASGGRTWLASGGNDVLVRNELTKSAGDAVRLAMDFGDLPELRSADITGTPTLTASPNGLTITTVQLDTDYRVSAKFAGGAAGTDYAVTFAATLSDGSTVSRTGTLRVV